MKFKRVVRTPGGRVGDDRTTGSRANGTNWVERTPTGKLPKYIRIVRNGLMKQGHSEARATALAVAAIKRWARGGDNVSPKVRAAAAAALAEWEAMKKSPKKSALQRSSGIMNAGKTDQTVVESHSGAIAVKSSGDKMQIEHKTVGVSGLKVLEDNNGIIEAFVSVTGLKDNVNDIIEPGAYEKTLAIRTPKGVWSHDWDTPTSKTLAIKELLPGDSELPKTLPNGDEWPADAGALKVKMQFNLETQRGQEAYSDVKFFGDQQEWSIGYNVPNGGATLDQKAGIRRIKTLDLYEFSPVLFGAMPAARTSQSVKQAQEAHMAYKTLFGADYYVTMDKKALDDFVIEMKDILHDGSEVKTDEDVDADVDETVDDLPDNFVDLAATGEKSMVSAANVSLIEKAVKALTDLLEAITSDTDAPNEDTQEEKGGKVETEHKTLADVLNAANDVLDEKTAETLAVHVADFDAAVQSGDEKAIEEHANSVLDVIDEKIDSVEDSEADGLKAIAAAINTILTKMAENDGDPEEDPEDTTTDANETDDEEKVSFDTTEFKDLKEFLAGLG